MRRLLLSLYDERDLFESNVLVIVNEVMLRTKFIVQSDLVFRNGSKKTPPGMN